MTSYFNDCDVTVANSNQKICYNFFSTCTCARPLWKKFRHPWWQVIMREYSKLQNANFRSCNFDLSRPEILRTFFELLCKKCWRWQYLLQAASVLSVNWNWSFHTSEPQWLRISQGSLYDLSLMSIKRGILCSLTGKAWIY